MPKIVKREICSKLYHGTTEIIAKSSCVKGLCLYDVFPTDNGVIRGLCSSTSSGICLTKIYSGLLSFYTTPLKEKWGIIEIDVSKLDSSNFLPHECFLLDKMKFLSEEERIKKINSTRIGLSSNKRKWKESLDSFGICVYGKLIPFEAISKVVIYDPLSNPFITKSIIGVSLGVRFHQSNVYRQGMIARWISGENITVEEWVGQSAFLKMEHSEKDKIAQILRNKNGLDVFHLRSQNSKKGAW